MIESTSPVMATTPATDSVPPAGFTPVATAAGTGSAASNSAVAGMEFASFGQRLAAILIDMIILAIPISLLDAVLSVMLPPMISQNAGSIAMLAYYIYMPTTTKGGTLGKTLMHIKIVDYSGNVIKFDRSLGRYFAQILSALPLCAGYFSMLFDPQHQTWHDKLAKTYVVKA